MKVGCLKILKVKLIELHLKSENNLMRNRYFTREYIGHRHLNIRRS